MYLRQSAQANINRSEGYKKTARDAKLSGHIAEHLFASFNNGEVRKGTGKTDVKDSIYGNCSVKAPAGGKIQMLLQVTENVGNYWGLTHPMYLASQAQRQYYEDRHFNNENNASDLYKKAVEHVARLSTWMENLDNFKQVLTYALANDGEIDCLVDMYRTNLGEAYITPIDDFIQTIIDAAPIPKQTRSGLRISVSINTGNNDKYGNPKRRNAFSFEVRSDAKHCKGLLYKMEAKVIFPIVRNNPKCIKVNAPGI
jgi:hypothetical protein